MDLSGLNGKRILLFSPAFFSYENVIAEKMRSMGAIVDLYDVRSVTSPFSRAIIKFFPVVFKRKTNYYYESILEDIKENEYDYILIIKCDMTPERILEKMKLLFPNAKFCLYLWDSVRNIPGVIRKFKFFDTIHSFDLNDCNQYNELSFRPLFYADDFTAKQNAEEYLFDISFIGTVHSDRFAVVKAVQKYAENNELAVCFHLYLQSKFIFYFYKLVKKEFKDASISHFTFNKMPFSDVRSVVEKSRAILDIQHPKQTGLTMRTIEMVGMNKKIVTTNESIKEYDFYNPNNIAVIDREYIEIDKEFFNSSYVTLSAGIYKKYSLEQWIYDVLD